MKKFLINLKITCNNFNIIQTLLFNRLSIIEKNNCILLNLLPYIYVVKYFFHAIIGGN